MDIVGTLMSVLRQSLAWLQTHTGTIAALIRGIAGLLTQLRTLGTDVRSLRPALPPAPAYETLWLELVLDLRDVRGKRAVLSRRQRVRFLARDGAVVRELVWGEGEQLVRYSVRGARRLAVRPEGSRCALLLDPLQRSSAGCRLTITSRRTLHDAFSGRDEYLESLLERPTGRLDFTVIFPKGRQPQQARLVVAGEQVVRTFRARYGADGRAVVRCRLRKPASGITYSLRWSW